MDPAERELFARGVRDAAAGSTGPALDAALGRLGWADALAEDGQAAVSALFEAQGRSATSSGALDAVLGAALGSAPGAVVLPPLGRTEPPGRLQGGALAVAGLALPTAAGDGPLHVVAASEGGLVLASVDPGALARRTVGGLDPALGLIELVGEVPGVATTPLPEAAWTDALVAGHRALAHELVGASDAMLDLAREHALERIQFGVPIASFQAVRHRLADVLVGIEAARAALDAAWLEPSALHGAAAKAIAGRSARLAARHCQQVLAGIGFTVEHPLHRYVRRTRLLDGLLGDSRSLTRRLGEDLLSARGLPAILPL